VRLCGMRKGITVEVTPADRARLQSIIQDRNSPQKHVWRARIIVLTADGAGTTAITRAVGKDETVVWRWQELFMHQGVEGLTRDKTRPSRIPPLPAETVDRVVALTNQTPPHEATHWTAPAMAKAVGISPSSVRRIWKGHRLQPHRVRSFKLSNDPKFAEKLKEVVGLYVDPPAHAVVLSLVEKSQIQALDRTQPGLPMKKGRCATMTHDYKRHGSTTLFAALDILEGKVIGRCMQRHRYQEFIRFLNAVERQVAADKAVHVVLDNYGYTQAPQGARLARTPSARHLPLHADVMFLGQRGRRLVCQTHQATPQARRLHLDRRTADRHQPLHRRGQRQTQAVRLDQIRRRDPRRRPTRETSVRSDPLGAPSLCSYNPLFLKVPHHRSFRRGAEYHCEERKHKSEKRQKPYCFASGEINIV